MISSPKSAAVPGAGDDAVRKELERILGSPVFEDAERLRRFLTFIVEETLAGRGSRLKESVIGVEVFGREASYDPKADPIVRVQARRLRAKLDACYQAASDGGMRIAIPKGGYMPVFDAEAPTQPQATPASRHRRTWAAVGTLALVLVAAAGFVARRNSSSEPARTRLFTTYPGYETTPAFSPDGASVTFAWNGSDGEQSDIFVQRQDSDTPRRITSSIAAEYRPVWLADGAHIGFLRDVGGRRLAVIIAPLLGAGEREFARIEADSSDPPRIEWTRDGKRLFASERAAGGEVLHVVEIDPDSGSRRVLTQPPPSSPGDSEVCLSPDGNWIAFRRTVESSIADVYVMPASGGPPRAVTHDGAGIIGLAWARDNRTLIVSSRRSSSLQRVWRFPLDGSAPVRLTEAAEAASYPNVNPRDGSIAYASRFLDANIWGIDLTGKMPPRRLIASNLLDSCPHYSPDGRRIAFRSNRTGNDELWVADANGGAPARLTSFEGPITGNARWSPDGAWLALDSRPHGHADVFLVPSGGGSARSLIEGPFNDVLPSFSADGTSVFFASDRSGRWEVWNQRLRGGGARQITTHGGFAPQVSADGRRIYYSKRDAEGLYSMPAAGGEETRAIDALPPSLWGGWALAGSDIVYLRTTGSRSEAAQLLVLNTATGRTTSAGRLQFPPVPWDGALSVSPDGRWALVSEIERAGSEIHLRDAE